MDHAHHTVHSAPAERDGHAAGASLNHTAFVATLHCLAGCAIGEVAGLLIGTALGCGNGVTIALAADAASITIMELVDNGLMLAIPGAMDAPIDSAFFWATMTLSLALAGVVANPVNRWLIARGQGHAVAHRQSAEA